MQGLQQRYLPAAVVAVTTLVVVINILWAPNSGIGSYSVDPSGIREQEDFVLHMKDASGKRISPWHDIALHVGSKGDGTFSFVCEIPRGDTAKMEINKEMEWNPIKQDVKHGKLRFYPSASLVNYGAIPQTWEDPDVKDPDTGNGGDNDPLDAIELGSKRCTVGEVYAVRAIGALALVDDGEMDWKIVLVRADDDPVNDVWKDASHPTDDQKAFLDEVRVWFRDYKLVDGQTNQFAYDGAYLGPARAREVILEQHSQWKSLVSKEHQRDSPMWWH